MNALHSAGLHSASRQSKAREALLAAHATAHLAKVSGSAESPAVSQP